jgi:hypothetical protein
MAQKSHAEVIQRQLNILLSSSPEGLTGIYVEITIQDDLEHIWRLTQEPALHQRWDLRFSRIDYLPKASAPDPQHFLYETRIGFGLSIKGTGESVGERTCLFKCEALRGRRQSDSSIRCRTKLPPLPPNELPKTA